LGKGKDQKVTGTGGGAWENGLDTRLPLIFESDLRGGRNLKAKSKMRKGPRKKYSRVILL